MDHALPPDSPSRNERHLLTVSWVAYLAWMAAPAFTALKDAWPGWLTLLMGPIGVPLGYVAWLANPLLWYGWRARARGRHVCAIVACAVALLLALSFLLHPTIPVGSSGDHPFSVSYGYALWLLSMIAALSAAYTGFCRVCSRGGGYSIRPKRKTWALYRLGIRSGSRYPQFDRLLFDDVFIG
jgi:hypothetical protein